MTPFALHNGIWAKVTFEVANVRYFQMDALKTVADHGRAMRGQVD